MKPTAALLLALRWSCCVVAGAAALALCGAAAVVGVVFALLLAVLAVALLAAFSACPAAILPSLRDMHP